MKFFIKKLLSYLIQYVIFCSLALLIKNYKAVLSRLHDKLLNELH